MPKLTRPEALNQMGVSIEQLTAYEKELKKFLEENTPRGFIEVPKGNGNAPLKKTKSRKAKKEKKEATEA